MKSYSPKDIESKWQKIWAQDKRYFAADESDKPKYYITGMFPYPSGAGMHTGHFFEHSIVDAVARFKRSTGHNVMYPMGWDSFGLPAENYAIKTGTAPSVSTKQNIANFTNQLKRVGASIDWSREINTSDPDYYKWTQWVFVEFFKRGLAYQKESLQWWCPADKTVLANEQVESGKCWRCGTEVEKKSMKQWFFKITEYADALLEEIPALDWPDKIKTAQENWIGRSEGAEIEFQVDGSEDVLTVFTTRPDTIFGATFMVIAPEHPLARSLVTNETRGSVQRYIDEAVKKSEIERQSEGKDKTGVFTGSYATNPANGDKIPIWIADYVLGGYGTGAIMAVPAHDERDYAFATKFDLPITQVIAETLQDSVNPPRSDKKNTNRKVVMCIIEHPTDGTFLTLRWNKLGWHNFVMGGIENDESAEIAARREITEETGYTDMALVDSMPVKLNSKFYAAHKDVNRDIITKVLRFKLNSLKRVDTNRELHEDFESEWIEKTVLSSLQPVAELGHILKWLNGERLIFQGEGVLINSGTFDGMRSDEAREEIVAWIEQQGTGRSKITYKMRDWLISRQRYWGAPIPIIHCEEHGAVTIPEDQLPILLPEVEDYAPKGDGKSPLARQDEWMKTTCPTCGKPARRETDVMDGYACSSWYLLRYTGPTDKKQAWDPKLANYWTPVDMYIGGDHAVAHLLYVRFWNHVFKDMGLVPTKEPVKKLVYHGLIQAEDGRKMSKSLGNVVDPLEVVDAGYGADSLRTFELFLGPINEDSNWSSKGIAGVYRFLNRVWTLSQEYINSEKSSEENRQLKAIEHRTIKKVTDDINRLSFNTAIASLMEYVNELYKLKLDGFSDAWQQPIENLVQLLSPFSPHLSAELWQQLGHEDQLDFVSWPKWDENMLVVDTIQLPVQINGKLRGALDISPTASEEEVIALIKNDEKIAPYLKDKELRKIIYVPKRIVNLVISA